MVVIATSDVDLALRLGKVVDDAKSYIVRVVDGKSLRHQIHSAQPTLVILDVRLGGNAFKALDEVSAIMETRSGPAVIVLTPLRSRAVEKEAAKLGCFDVLSLDRRAFLKAFSRAVLDAQAAYLAGVHVRAKSPDAGSVH